MLTSVLVWGYYLSIPILGAVALWLSVKNERTRPVLSSCLLLVGLMGTSFMAFGVMGLVFGSPAYVLAWISIMASRWYYAQKTKEAVK